MKKHRYSAKNIKQADWKQIGAQTADRRIVFGVDVAKDDFFGVLMQEDLTVSATLKWVHPRQTRELAEHLLQDVQAQRLEVVMEASGTYGDALYRHLSRLGVAVYRVSPKRVHDAAEVYDGVPSLHDAKSAYIIGRLHLDGASRVWGGEGDVTAVCGTLVAVQQCKSGTCTAGIIGALEYCNILYIGRVSLPK